LLLPLWLWLWLTLLLLGLTLLWRGSGLGSWRLGLRMGLERQDLCFQRLEFLLHLDHLRYNSARCTMLQVEGSEGQGKEN